KAGTNKSLDHSSCTSENDWTISGSSDQRTSTTYSPPRITGQLHINAAKVLVDEVERAPLEFLQKATFAKDGTEIQKRVLRNIFTHESHSERHLGAAPRCLIGLATTVATGGLNLGGSVASLMALEGAVNAMVTAVINAAVAHTATTLAPHLATHGDLGEALRHIKSGEHLRSLSTQTLVAAVSAGVCHRLEIPQTGG